MRIAYTKVGRLTTRLLPSSQALVVSIHDVSPHTRAECEEIFAQLRELGLKSCSWLVVPDHHHRGHFLDDPDFCAWLCALEDADNEIVIHGYYHQREEFFRKREDRGGASGVAAATDDAAEAAAT